MMKMNLFDVAFALGGSARVTSAPYFERICTDTRALRPDSLFVALKGDVFDGHDFIAQAAEHGAVAAMVDASWFDRSEGLSLPMLVVDDTRAALGAFARAYRSRFTLPLIGITGSNGKTTVKDMCACILRAQARLDGYGNDTVLATRGNLNNDIGLPLTLLELTPSHRAAVIEIGMNRSGEIAYLSGIAQPTVALVNNAQRAHLLGLGSVDEIAREKGRIFEGLTPNGTAVINLDDAYAALWQTGKHRTLTFSLVRAADVTGRYSAQGFGSRLEMETPQGRVEVVLQIPGEHNVRNALAAATACLAAGASLEAIETGLSQYGGTPGRLQRKTGPNGALLIDDTYNANPDSFRAGIDVLAALPGRRVLVLGDMGEVGDRAAALHEEIGQYAKAAALDALYGLGELSAEAIRAFGAGARHFDDAETLAEALMQDAPDADTAILVKGSRFMKMERIVERLTEPAENESSKGAGHAA